MSTDFKKIVKQEYLKCVQDPIHFMRKYCTIQHPKKGKMKFDLYPFQEQCLTDFNNNRYNIILKARQLGISTLSAGYSLWMMLFQNDLLADKKVHVINGTTPKDSTEPGNRDEIIKKFKEIYQSQVPLEKRLAKPIDVANLVQFLCSKNSNYITGENILVTGGSTMH